MSPRPATLAALLAAIALSGCGNERTLPPDVATPGPPLGANPARFPAAGISFAAPAGWRQADAPAAPLVTSLSTGRAILSVYRYPRTEPLPRSRKALKAALEALAGAAKQRDGSLVVLKRSTARVNGKPATVLRATETIDGQARTVRSVHVYSHGGEVVIDAIAPAADFKRVDAQVFRPVVRSLKIARPVA